MAKKKKETVTYLEWATSDEIANELRNRQKNFVLITSPDNGKSWLFDFRADVPDVEVARILCEYAASLLAGFPTVDEPES